MTRRDQTTRSASPTDTDERSPGLPTHSGRVQSLPPPRKHPIALAALAVAYGIWLIVLAWIAVLVQRGI